MERAEDYYLNVFKAKVPLLMLMVSGVCFHSKKQLFCLF